jgi:hypothetical protein
VDIEMTRRNYNPRTRRLLSLAESTKALRLTKADREFLRDLGKVQIISAAQAAEHHYSHLKTQGTQSLQRLEDAGILRSRNIYVAGQGRVKTFEFSSHEMAVAWGGRLPRTGSSRSDYHELITSEAYFRLGRPSDFRLASKFTKEDRKIVGEHLPDAVYTDHSTGELILFEADAGNYSKQQIQQKSLSWERRGLKQTWAQPEKATSKIKESEQMNVLTV